MVFIMHQTFIIIAGDYGELFRLTKVIEFVALVMC